MSEQFWVVLLDRRNHPLGRHRISIGTATATLAHPREVYRVAVLGSAVALIAVHNHPSGCSDPSAADIQLTQQLAEAGRILDIPLMDHVIIGDGKADPQGLGYYSFRNAGLL